MVHTRKAGSALSFLFLVAAGCADDIATPLDPELTAARPAANRSPHLLPSTVQDFLNLGVKPVVIAHRGMGPNLGEDSSRPIENTVQAVRWAFERGASVVEVDLQMTADGEIVSFHDDFLEDFTCINSLTRAQLAQRAPHIDSFQAVLQTALRYNRLNPDRLTGLITVDLKPVSPLCDPNDATEAAYIAAVVSVVRRMGATDLIYFNSMSPVLLGLAAQQAPEIPRQLTILLLQLLQPEQISAALGMPVVLIDKTPSYGLQWGEIGQIFRLPGYSSPQQAIATALATRSRMISFDLRLLGYLEQQQPGAAAGLVQAARAYGLHVLAGDVSTAADWSFGVYTGVDALYADNVPLALGLQPTLP